MQNSHKQCIAEMQKDCQTYQIAVNIIAVIIFIKFHWHTVNLLSFHSCREASFYTALHRFVNSRKNSAVYGILAADILMEPVCLIAVDLGSAALRDTSEIAKGHAVCSYIL